MDDLDDELFGSLLKSKSSTGKTVSEITGKKTKEIDFDEDDPLAGLLSDDDNDSPAVRKTIEKSKNGGIPIPAKGPPGGPAIESYRPAGRRKTALDDLLARSDAVKTTEQSVQPAGQGFVLRDKYKSVKSSEETDKSSNVSEQHKQSNDILFGGYVPSVENKIPSRRRAVPGSDSAITNDKNVNGALPSKQVQNGETNFQEKKDGAVSIAPTINNAVKPSRGRNSDWLELKEESSVVVTNTNRAAIFEDDSIPIQPRRPKKEVKVDEIPIATTPETTLSNSQKIKTNSFLDWLGAKKDEQPTESPQKLEPVTPTMEEASNVVEKTVPQKVLDRPNASALQSAVKEKNLLETDFSSSTRVEYETRLAHMRMQMADIHTKFNEESLTASATILDLQTKVRRLEFERDQLSAALDGLESRHNNELVVIETSLKKRMQMIEESYQRREQRLQEELDAASRVQTEKLNAWELERSEIISTWQRRVDETASERIVDLDRIRENHRLVIAEMKKDHDLAIARLQQIKEIEFGAVTEAQSHSKTLQLVIDQLRSNTSELGQLQMKVEGGFHAGLTEREMLLETKDQQLKLLQEQLKKQQEDNEQERVMLRQLIKRLEDRLHQQTLGLEEERWKMMQDRNKLEADWKIFEESQKLTNEKLEHERLQLKKAKDQFLDEQKSVMQQMYSEKQKFFAGPVQVNLQHLDPVFTEVNVFDGFPSLKAQAEFEASLRAIKDEKARLTAWANQLKLQAEQLAEERSSLESQQAELEEEKLAINALAVQVKRHSEETEEMCLAAAQTREEGLAAFNEANRLKIELQKRQEVIREEFNALKSRERQLAEQRLSLADQRRHFEHLRTKLLCVRCQSPIDWGSYSSSLSDSFHLLNKEFFVSGNKNLQNGFEAWHLAAEKDKEYLAKERLFLRTLKTNLDSSQ